MRDKVSHQAADLLVDWSKGDESTLKQLMPLVYDELCGMARHYMNKQPLGHTLQATGLVHEAYLKLAAGKDQQWQNCEHFLGVMAKTMRHILVDVARSKNALKNGGREIIELSNGAAISVEPSGDFAALYEALNHLAVLDNRKSRVVRMKFFAGLDVDEIAGVLKISPLTVKRDWQFARTWLLRKLTKTDSSPL